MGFPINLDGTIDYDSPAPTPTHLTDGAAEYVAPSEAAMALALSIHDSFIRTADFELSMNRIAMMFDAFAAQQAAEAERARYNALKAVADSMAKAVRGVKADAVFQTGYEGNDYEYPVHIVDSDYTHELYKTLAEYEKATDPAPPRSKCPSCKDSGYIWATETPDTGHDFQMNCPVCNPKIDLYAADRYEPDF